MSDVFFPDLCGSSQSDRYRVDVQSPMNGAIADRNGVVVAEPARTMQHGFRYGLTDKRTNQLLWERWQEPNEGSPAECVVGDDGWVVVRTHSFYPQVLLIAPTGEVSVRVKIRSARPYKGIVIPSDAETWIDEHVMDSSAGLYWADNSWRYFFERNAQRYFVWRPYWGRRLVFALDGLRARRLPEDEANVLQDTMAREEGAWASCYLAEAASRTELLQAFLSDTYENRCKPNPFWQHMQFLIPAIHLSGVHGRRECIRDLLELESLSFIRSYGSCRAIGIGKGWSFETELFRPVVQHSLQRLGQEPRGLPPFHFGSKDGRRLGSRGAYERRTIPDQVRLGMTPIETLECIGSPDDTFEGAGKDGLLYWDYDFQVNEDWSTHRLVWSRSEDGNRLAEIQTLSAPWLTTTNREFKYLRS